MTSAGTTYLALKAEQKAEGDRFNFLTVLSGAIVTSGAITLQASMQTLFDAIVQLTNFDIIAVMMPLFITCLVISVYFSHQINLYISKKRCIMTDPPWPFTLLKLDPNTWYLVVLIFCSIFAAGAQSAFSISIISRFKDKSDGVLWGVVIVSLSLVFVSTYVTGAALVFARKLNGFVPFSSGALANPMPYPGRAFGMAATIEAKIVDKQFTELFEHGK